LWINLYFTLPFIVHVCHAQIDSFLVITVFPLIEAGSQIQAGSLIEDGRGRSKDEYTARLLGLPGISLCSNKYTTKNLVVLNTCSSVNRVVLIEAGSLIQAGWSNTIVLIEAGGLLLEVIQYSYY